MRGSRTLMRKPANLVYGVEEAPPHLVTLISAVQHVGVIAIFMVYPLIIGAPGRLRRRTRSPTCCGWACSRSRSRCCCRPCRAARSAAGFLAPSIFTGVYLAPSLLAVKTGGLPLVWGMTIFAGLVEIALSRVWSRLRHVHSVGDRRPRGVSRSA